MKRALTIQNIMDKKYRTLELTGEWREAFGPMETQGVWFVWGRSGNGKTRFVMQLCKELTKFGRGLYVSLEEGSGLTFANALHDTGMQEVGRRMLVTEPEYGDADGLIADLTARMKRQRSPMFIVIDSFQYTGLTFRQYTSGASRLLAMVSLSLVCVLRGRSTMPPSLTPSIGSVMTCPCLLRQNVGLTAISAERFRISCQS